MKRQENLKGNKVQAFGSEYIVVREYTVTNRDGITRELMVLAKHEWFMGQTVTVRKSKCTPVIIDRKAAADKIAQERAARRTAKFEARQKENAENGHTVKTIEQIYNENIEAKTETTKENSRSFQWDFSN